LGPAELPRLDAQGRYHAHGKVAYEVVAVYLFMFLVFILLLPRSIPLTYWWGPWVLGVLDLAMLVRYLSTTYRIDDIELRAWRLLGGRRVRLDQVRRIEYASLRDLSPGSFLGGWGWRGRMWSARIGPFDSLHTDPALGILVTPGDVPLFVTPRNPTGFARELSRRVRSHTGRIAVDVGDPLGPAFEPGPGDRVRPAGRRGPVQ
jgi:hypothetical protein